MHKVIRRVFGTCLIPFLCSAAEPQKQVVTPTPKLERAEIDPTYTTWFDRRLAVIEAKVATAEHDDDNLSLLLSLIGTGFGTLLTVLVIFFALRADKSAAASAAEAAKKAIAEALSDVETHKAAAFSAKCEAEELLKAIRQHKGSVDLEVANIKAASAISRRFAQLSGFEGGTDAGLSAGEEVEVEEAYLRIVTKDQQTWTYDEAKVVYTEHSSKSNYEEALKVARLLEEKSSSSLETAEAINYIGYQLARLGSDEEAAAQFRRVISVFGGDDDPHVRGSVAKATFNLGNSYSRTGHTEQAKATYTDLIEKRDVDSLAARIALGKSLVNLAKLEKSSGDTNEQRRLLLQTEELLSGFSEKSVQEIVARGMWLLARSFEADSQLAEAIAAYQKLMDYPFLAKLDEIDSFVDRAGRRYRWLMKRVGNAEAEQDNSV